MMATCVMIILAFLSFTFIFWLLKRKLLIEYMKQPPGIVCANVLEGLGPDLI